jgi:hypothetical protein
MYPRLLIKLRSALTQFGAGIEVGLSLTAINHPAALEEGDDVSE